MSHYSIKAIQFEDLKPQESKKHLTQTGFKSHRSRILQNTYFMSDSQFTDFQLESENRIKYNLSQREREFKNTNAKQFS